MVLRCLWPLMNEGKTKARGEKRRHTSTHSDSQSLLPGNAWAFSQASPQGCFTLRAQGSVGRLCIAGAQSVHLYRLQNKKQEGKMYRKPSQGLSLC